MTYRKHILGFVLAGLALLAVVLVYPALAHISQDSPPGASEGMYRNFQFFASTTGATFYATSTSATSTNITQYVDSKGFLDKGYFVIAGAKKVEFYFTRGDQTGKGNTGTSTFKVQISPDATTWYDFGKLILATTTNQTLQKDLTIQASTSTVPMSLNLDFDTFYAVRCVVVEEIDGEHTCSAAASW